MAACSRLFVILVITGALVTGCGSGGNSSTGGNRSTGAHGPTGSRSSGSSGAPAPGPAQGSAPGLQAVPAPAPTGLPADPAAVRVIRAWSSALRHGDVLGAARYFALPSQLINGVDANGLGAVITIRTRREAAAANAILPCGAVFLSADQRGRFVNVLFRLTNRPGPGGGCGSGVGQKARTNFVIAHGQIVEWIRAPDEPGDNPPPPAPGNSGPGNQTTTGPAV